MQQLNQKIKIEGATEKNVISQLWFKYFPYWPLFIIFLILSIVGAKYKLRHATPLYQATATILIKDEKKGLDDNKLIQEMNQLSSKKIIENEIEVLKSRELMDEVVKNLHLYARIYEKKESKYVPAYTTSPVTIQAMSPDSITGANEVYFNYDKAKGQVIIGNKAFPVNEWVNTSYGILKFIFRPVAGSSTEPMYFSISRPKYVSPSFLGGLSISSASKQSSVINLKILDEVQHRSADVLNGLIAAYNNAAIKDKNKLATTTLKFVDERLDIVGKDLTDIETKLQKYKSDRGAVEVSSQGQMFLETVNVNDQKLGDVNVRIAVLDQIENYVRAKDNTGGIVPSTVGVDDPLLSSLLTKLYDYELEYDKLRTTTGEGSSILLSLNDRINKIKPSILENINNQKKSLEASRSNLYSTNNRYSSMLNALPKMERDLLEISREQNIKSGIYNYLLQKREETALSQVSNVADSRVIDKAQASFNPVSPNPKKFYIMALVLAFGIAIAIVTATEMLKRTILFRHEIEKYTSVPIIGEIAHEKSKNPLVIGLGKRTFIAEQFRKLRTSLPYIGLVGQKKKLLITSNASGDGKSFVVANLGLSLAMVDKKVVVLEFDLSNPTLSDKLNVTTINKGLTDFLRGHAEPEEIIRRTTVNENLFVMPAGTLPENPSELIMSNKVQDLMEFLTPLFDYIIIDTAPVGLLSDAYVLSAYCDATLYVIRHGHTSKVSVERMDANNKINELKNMAIVFNGIKSRGFGKNGYGYGYGYGYISKEKEIKRKKISRAQQV